MSRAEFRIRYWGTTGSLPGVCALETLRETIALTLAQLPHHPRGSAAGQGLLSESELRQLASELISDEQLPWVGQCTTCIEIAVEDSLFIVDAGSGLRQLGLELLERREELAARPIHLLLTHAHLDHLCGLPFFEVAYDPAFHLTLWGSEDVLAGVRALLGRDSMWRNRFFPATLELMSALVEFRPLVPAASLQIGQTQLQTLPLRHPGESLGYRLNRASRSLVIATDHEQDRPLDQALATFAKSADWLYVDAQYSEREYLGEQGIGRQPAVPRNGWGHSTIESAVRTAVAAEVKQLHLGHLDPARTHRELRGLAEFAQRHLQLEREQNGTAVPMSVRFAREGDQFEI